METGVEGQSLTAEDQLFILYAGGAISNGHCEDSEHPRRSICYERAESLCHSLNRPRLLYVALIGQWRYSLITDTVTATMQIAKRVYSLAQEQNDSALMIGAYRALAGTLFYLGDFESARQYAMRAIQIWRSGERTVSIRKTSTRPSSFVCAIRRYPSGISERSPLAKRRFQKRSH